MSYKNNKEEFIEGEEWRDVVNYEGYYEVSNLGRVRSVSRIIPRKKRKAEFHETGDRLMKGRILSQREQKLPLGNYLIVRLSVKGIAKNHRVHRLVAEAFIPNPHNYPQVNHIDRDPTNNAMSNLEWVTPSGNMQHAVKLGHWSPENVEAMRKANCKRVIGIDKFGNKLTFNSAKEAAQAMGLKQLSSITNVCRGIKKTAAGYSWQYI